MKLKHFFGSVIIVALFGATMAVGGPREDALATVANAPALYAEIASGSGSYETLIPRVTDILVASFIVAGTATEIRNRKTIEALERWWASALTVQ